MEVDNRIEHTAANGNGPVEALDNALRKALEKFYPEIGELQLSDYKVRVLNEKGGTASPVRVLIDQKRRTEHWGTVGVSTNIIEASWQALVDGIETCCIKSCCPGNGNIPMDNSQPIGIFDSGVGGLTVCKAIHDLLPAKELYISATPSVFLWNAPPD